MTLALKIQTQSLQLLDKTFDFKSYEKNGLRYVETCNTQWENVAYWRIETPAKVPATPIENLAWINWEVEEQRLGNLPELQTLLFKQTNRLAFVHWQEVDTSEVYRWMDRLETQCTAHEVEATIHSFEKNDFIHAFACRPGKLSDYLALSDLLKPLTLLSEATPHARFDMSEKERRLLKQLWRQPLEQVVHWYVQSPQRSIKTPHTFLTRQLIRGVLMGLPLEVIWHRIK